MFNTEAFLRTAAFDLKPSFERLASMEKSSELNTEAMLTGMVEDQVTAGKPVIEGRAAMLVLDKEATLKVFLHREKQGRVALVASRRGMPIQEAQAEVEFFDR
jgi:cytidylate kinase